MLHRRLLGLSALVMALGMALALAGCQSHAAADPYRPLRAALHHMKAAREEVEDEKFKPHREKIERDLRAATHEIERALRDANIDVGYEPHKGWDEKHKSLRHLRQALIELDLARDEVRKEKGDWAQRRELKEAIEDAHDHLRDALKDIE
jgi:hypothetical protein